LISNNEWDHYLECAWHLSLRPTRKPDMHVFDTVFWLVASQAQVDTIIFKHSHNQNAGYTETCQKYFCDYFKIFFGSTDFKCSWFKHKLKLFVFKYTIIVLYFWLSKFSFVFKSWTHR
jgi:hypothetical protein